MANPPANSDPSKETPELRLLLACARTDSRIVEQTTLLEGVDWPKFLELARSHHVTPLMNKSIALLPAGAVPQDVRDGLRDTTTYVTRRNLFLLGELVRVANLLDQHQIPLLPFKGPVLALQAYRELSLRQCGDLDVLVRPADVPLAKKVLLDSGLEQFFPTSTPRETEFLKSMNPREEAYYIDAHSEYHLVRAKDRLNIDLHWRLNPPEMRVSFSEAELWGRLESFLLAGRQVLRLAPADSLLLLCFNGAKDCWERLDRICDIAELLRSHPNVAWNEALDRARAIGVERMVVVGLALAEDLLDAPLTPELAAAIEKDSVARGMVPELRQELAHPSELLDQQGQIAPTLLHIRMRERWRDKVRYCWARLSPTVGDWVAMPLPRSLSFLYYILRPIRLTGRMVKNKLGMSSARM